MDDDALFQTAPSFFFASGGLLSDDLLAGSDDALLLLVDLDDLQLHFLADEVSDLLDVVLSQLGSGHEGAHALHVADQATLDGFLAGADNVLAVLVLGQQGLPGLAVNDVALGQNHVALAVVDLDDLGFDLVVQVDVFLGQVGALDDAVGLVADVDADFVFGDLHNLTGDGLAGADAGQARHDGIHGKLGVLHVGHLGYNLLK